jgi:predicted RecA/RadA family phage recombinase
MRNIRYFLLSLLFAISIVVFVSCGGSSSNTGTAVTPTPSVTHTATATPVPSHFKVGQTVKVGDTWELIIEAAKNGGTASYLKSGQVFLDIKVKARNISQAEQTMSSLVNWTVRDRDGTTYNAGYDPNAGSGLSGKVEAGQPLQGSLTFVVSEKVHQYLLFFQASFAETGQTIWDLKI